MEFTRISSGQEREIFDASELFDEPLDPEAVRAYIADERNIFLLASDRRRAVGFLRGTALGQLKSTRRQMFLYEIGVVPEYRRRGIARELVRLLLNHCRDQNFEELFVLTDPGNEGAVTLYKSTGATTETSADRMFVYRF
jgi:aminoglycoside 3-N-acetyltransferase I